MLTRPDSSDRLEIATDMAVEILRESGATALTLSAIARRMGQTPGALIHRFESRDRVFGMVLMTIAERWEHHVCDAWYDRQSELCGLGAFLPTEEEVPDLRLWWSAGELALATGRSHLLTQVRRVERALAVRSLVELGRSARVEERADLVLATIDGLRLRTLDPGHHLPRAQALLLVASSVHAPPSAA